VPLSAIPGNSIEDLCSVSARADMKGPFGPIAKDVKDLQRTSDNGNTKHVTFSQSRHPHNSSLLPYLYVGFLLFETVYSANKDLCEDPCYIFNF
jgi:hypothetical protein